MDEAGFVDLASQAEGQMAVPPAPHGEILTKARRLKRRRRVEQLVAAIAVSITGIALAVVSPLLHGNQASPTDTDHSLTLPLGDWPTDGSTLLAAVGGALAVNPADCVYIRQAGEDYGALWPAGFSSQSTKDGVIEVVDDQGRVVASSRADFVASGGYLSLAEASSAVANKCYKSTDITEVMLVQAHIHRSSGIGFG
jgi:hypothetical protein